MPSASHSEADAEHADKDYIIDAESEPDDEATLEEEEHAARMEGGDAKVPAALRICALLWAVMSDSAMMCWLQWHTVSA